ncbi:beta/gamma crystallin domain-containing protein 1 [Choloepus didactylus]|uniref:beta/gamma crystallin domain-containing protein 1 n=1 Tax=Choloepus didactylus TaxID=27675 RepID=UPI00189F75DA|nr:beta/gamma crystallin domain-containing protein 1 [Choloepus didactylus]
MPPPPPALGHRGESSPSRAPKKHATFHIWRSKKKQQPLPVPSDCGVFIPHPLPAPLGEARALEVADGSHVAQESKEFTLHCGESQFFHTTNEVHGPLPTECGMFKKSRAQPPEENKRKPVLGKFGNLFTAGRRRNISNGLESPTNLNAKPASPKDVAFSKLSERGNEKSKSQGSQPRQTDACVEGFPQEKPREPEGEPAESCVQAAPPDAERSPFPSSHAAAAAVQQCHESDSPQLEPLEAEGEAFSATSTAAKQLHSTPENSSRRENAETPACSPGEDASPSAGRGHETVRGERGVPGTPIGERPAQGLSEGPDRAEGRTLGAQVQRSQHPEAASAPPGDPAAQHTQNRASSAQADGKAGPGGHAHPAKVLTLDIYLSKTEAAPVDEPVVIAPGAEDCGDLDDMEKRASGRRSGRRRKSQKSTDSPGADSALPESPARDDAVFDDEVAPVAATEKVSAEKKVKSPQAAPEGGVASAGNPESRASPGPKGQPRAESDRGKQPLPASSPTKRKGRSRVPEAVPAPPASGPRAPAKESPPKRTPAPDAGPAARGAAGESGEEAAGVTPRELTVKSSSLLPEFKPEHKRGPLPNHFDGRGEGGRSRELGRWAGGSDADGLRLRNHFGAGRSTVTTKVTLPAKPKHVELNFKPPKNLDSLGNEHNPFSHPVHKGNTATKISLFENKRANSSPRHTETRGTRNISASNKTFVGQAKLNLAKKAKEMEQPEKKVMPNSHQDGALVKETSAETKVTLPEEDILPATRSPGVRGKEEDSTEDQALGSQLTQGDTLDVQTDAGCPSDPGVTALIPGEDHKLVGQDDLKAADSQRLVLENMADTAQDLPVILDTKDSPPIATPKQQDKFSDSQPPAETPNGTSLSLTAPVPLDVHKDTCAQVPISSFPSADLRVSENHNGCKLPESHQNNEELDGGEGGEVDPPLTTEHSPEAVGNECPSKVLVQVRSFMLPMESTTQDLSSQILSDSPEVREVQLPSCHNNELEVVSVASCAPQKEEELGNKSTPSKHSHHKEEHVANSGLQVRPPESEKTLPVQAQRQGGETPHVAESSSTNSPCSRNHLETPQRPDHSVTNGQDSPVSLLSISAGSDDSVFDSSSDMEKFTEIIKRMESSICVPQKKKKSRMPNSSAPHFAMPPIHEDNLEKVLDPSMFTFGLGKLKERQPEMSSALHLMQNLDTKSKLRPKRASAEESILLKSLNTNGKNQPVVTPEINGKENKDITNSGVKRSRLEKSALFSSMLSSNLPQDKIFSPSVTSVNTMTTSFSTSQNTSLSRSSVLQPKIGGAPPCGSDKDQPNLPPSNSLKVFNFDSSSASHSGLKSPSSMEKHLQKEETEKDLDSRSNLHLPETTFSEFSKLKNNDDMEKSNHIESVLKPSLPNHGNGDMDFMGLFKSSRFDPNVSFSGLSLSDTLTFRGTVHNKINPRPGKVVIYREPDVSEDCIDVFSDTEDCSSWNLSPVILIKVVRGCWILYEKPNFEGCSIALEEGDLELSGLWGIEDVVERNDEAESPKPVVIGSIRHVVQDYRISQIDLFTEREGLGLLNSYFDDTEEIQGFGVLQKTCSIKVHWGTWLIYEEPGFQGVPFILEPGEYPDLSFWGTEEAYIGSMRPLKMGGRKVEFPTDPKAVIYEKPFFEGKCMELETEMYSFILEGGETDETSADDCLPFTSVGSMKVLRGIWVAYEKPGFTGHQYLLEEGEYKDWKDWGGYNGEIQSLRPILGDFSNAHMIMYSEKNFGSKGSSIDVLGIVANLKETGYGVKTQSINVLSGVWVAYENPDFMGEQYILDKGFYASFEDWGGKSCKISSVQPICLDSFTGPSRRNQIHLFSEPQFQGCSQSFEETASQIDDSFSTKSCRVLGGSWVAYDGENFTGNQYVLEEGHYPCLSAMGCLPGATFKSLRFIDVEFSEPTIILFEREDFKGKKIELNSETVNLRLLGFSTRIRSLQVIGGIWVTYEYGNYRGQQFLLSPAEIPNWYDFSGCRQIGSLRPFVQKRIYFRLRNKATGLFMSTNGNLEDLKLLRIQVMEDVHADDQIWIYQEGCIKCRIAEDCCLTIVGSLVTSGSKLGLALEQNADSQFWSMKSDGRIYSKLKPNLVLDIKGGAQYDQNHVILNTVNKEKFTQVWEAMVL